MTKQHLNTDEFEKYEEQFNPIHSDRKARRKRKNKVKHVPKKSDAQILDEIADASLIEGDFDITYKAAKHEAIWLMDSLRPFFVIGMIEDVMSLVKGGKEANVYRCRAHPNTGKENLAVKVYRPRMFRNLRNDHMYRQGRRLINVDGKEVKERDQRLMRAVGQGTGIGQQLTHTSWLMHEYTTLQTLHKSGASVPQPFMSGENAILMDYIGNEYIPAPALNEVGIDVSEALALFDEVMRNVILMLKNGWVHGDLSAYNILYWEGQVTLIDFPQVTNVHSNRNARKIFERDIIRVCEYFSDFGVDCNPVSITNQLWRQHIGDNDIDPVELMDEA